MRILFAAATLALAAALLRPAAGSLGLGGPRLPLALLAGWALFGLAAVLVLRTARPGRGPLVLVVGIAAACQLPGLFGPPLSSDDAYRYVWDGRVQLAGESPYAFAPLDDRLARLRDPLLFPGLGPAGRSGYRTPAALPDDPAALAALVRADPRTLINRPRVPTVYPPLGQAWFTAVAAVTPDRAGTLGVRAGAAGVAVLTTLGLALGLRRRGRDPATAMLWGWCPLVAHEAGNGGHLDVLAAGLVVAAVAASARPVRSGLLLGAAAAVKLSPLLLVPAFMPLRRSGTRSLLVAAAALATLAAGYLPHLLAAGPRVLGYLPGYLNEEGFAGGGHRYAVLRLLLPGLPDPLRAGLALLLAAGLAGVAVLTADPGRPERTAVWLAGSAVLISTSGYPWYCLPLVALAVPARRPEWLAVAVAASVVGYLPNQAGWCYGLAAAAVAAVSAHRFRRRRYGQRSGPGRPDDVRGQHQQTARTGRGDAEPPAPLERADRAGRSR